MEFMRSELIRYGAEHGEDLIMSERMKGAENSARRYATVSDLAKRLGVRRSTVNRWADKGLLRSKTALLAREQRRLIVDTAGLDTTARTINKVLCQRQAARYIGLPASMLHDVRKNGYYSSDPIVNGRRGYWKIDLDQLVKRLNLVQCKKTEGLSPSPSISLEELITRYRFGSATAKAQFLGQILEGQITPVCKTGESFLGLRFDVEDIKKIRSKILGETAGERLTYVAAGKLIGCDRTAVPALVRDGFLARPPGASRGVLRTTVEAFLAQWIPRKQAALQFKMSSERLDNLVEASGYRVLRFDKHSGGAIFVERAALERFRSD